MLSAMLDPEPVLAACALLAGVSGAWSP